MLKGVNENTDSPCGILSWLQVHSIRTPLLFLLRLHLLNERTQQVYRNWEDHR